MKTRSRPMDLQQFYREDHTFYKSSLATSTARLALEERLRNFTSVPTAYSGTNRERGSSSLSCRRRPSKLLHKSRSQPPYDGRGSNRVKGAIMKSTTLLPAEFCLTDGGVVPKFYTGSDHHLLRTRFFSRKGEKAAKYEKCSHYKCIVYEVGSAFE
ncbi:hypothetical protein Y032_0733g1924 [Ancylostoma ceylanicum]|uniref:Uncharacterized protein n=1 Tax=Ancylostoma ceylanicum TaxID=53326 RepID=A0A016WFY9_9BILA|nr:hypothetical protein Y032_0733g1924 [Ancylostoma ceylanicum]